MEVVKGETVAPSNMPNLRSSNARPRGTLDPFRGEEQRIVKWLIELLGSGFSMLRQTFLIYLRHFHDKPSPLVKFSMSNKVDMVYWRVP